MKIKKQFFLLAFSIISIPLLCVLYIMIESYIKSPNRVLIKGYKEIKKLDPEMNEKEKVMNVAFAVSSSFIIGDHLAFVAANSANMIVPMIISNLLGGVIAVILVNTLNKND